MDSHNQWDAATHGSDTPIIQTDTDTTNLGPVCMNLRYFAATQIS